MSSNKKFDNPNTLFDESKIADNEYVTLYQCTVNIKNGIDLIVADLLTSDPYCEVIVAGMTRTTKIIDKTLNPVWNETFTFYTEGPEVIWFKVYDHDDVGKNDFMGECSFDTKVLFNKPGAASPNGEKISQVSKLLKVKKGSIGYDITCRTMTPVKTERLLAICEQQLAEAKTELDKQVALAESLKNEIEIARRELAESKQAYAAAAAEAESVKRELAHSRIETAHLQDELTQSQKAHQAATIESESARKELAERESKLQFLESKMKELQSTIGARTKEVEELQRKLSEKEAEGPPIVVTADKPFCVCCGANCSIM
eukprot:TRINITY_DN233_c0_g1_i1.p1 TRINITY_DN233_c0_g1~~TRINITY_DN233_c0_g1_i1.p1  ORF type:complete len:316 (-),score=114.50 TRINITY_DN233_c0_g1_i1:31-978(-)